jgi:hypothetical protein
VRFWGGPRPKTTPKPAEEPLLRLVPVGSISEAAGQELLWMQPAARKRDHELRAGDDVVATLRFQRGSLADAEADNRHWTFKRQGFWHPRVTVRVAGSDADIALFHPHWASGGTLEFADGQTLKLSSANFWQSEWVWLDKDQPVVHFKGRHGIVKAKGAVEIQAGAANRTDLALLVLLGWYLILLHADDAAAASGAASVAVISST